MPAQGKGGKPSTDWERIESEYRAGRGHYPVGEDGVMQFIKDMLRAGVLADWIGTPPIIDAICEYPLLRGRADFVLFHDDGTATVIEAKNRGYLRDILGGIGQLMSYSAQLGMAGNFRRIRSLLVAPLDESDDNFTPVILACVKAGVDFWMVGSMSDHERRWASFANERRSQ